MDNWIKALTEVKEVIRHYEDGLITQDEAANKIGFEVIAYLDRKKEDTPE